ncbi:MAG TPA: DUF3617 family protein [Dissulfurispiraceae bacterium]|nr:DUF3617 family protein [Dissulfurispiraceae bacterium]
MKRCTGLTILFVVLAFALIMGGCSQKQEGPAPASKPAARAVNMQDGQWEITSSVDMPNLPAGASKPHTFTTCMNQKDNVPKSAEKSDCTMQESKIEGDTVTWTMVCKDSTSKGKITYAGTSFDGQIQTTMKERGEAMTVNMTMKGKHLGPCPK